MNLLKRQSARLRAHCVARLVGIAILGFLPAGRLHAQVQPVEIVPSTPLWIELPKHSPMRSGEQIDGRLLYAVYVGDRVALPYGFRSPRTDHPPGPGP